MDHLHFRPLADTHPEQLKMSGQVSAPLNRRSSYGYYLMLICDCIVHHGQGALACAKISAVPDPSGRSVYHSLYV